MKLAPKLFVIFIFLLQYNIVRGQQPTDCIDAVIACGNSNINLDVSGVGTQELSGSNNCSSQENNSVWLKVTLVTSGTLGFTLTPNSTAISEDYDFFVFGPNVSCSNIGQAIRCSTTNPQAAGQGNNLTGMNASSSDTAEGPGADGDSFVRWLDVLAGETYFIVIDRPIGNSPFSLQWTGTAQFSDPPSDQSNANGTPLNLESCDVVAPFNDGFTTFDLSANNSLITGTQSDITISYHENISDANIGINELSSPYTNINNPQTIHARITNNTTGCFELTSFQLDVNLGPNFAPPTDYELCDDATDGNNTNGRVNFDLSSRNTEILNGQNPADFNITYHTSQFDAENRANPLPNPYYNSTPFNEQVFVRIEDALNTDCKNVTPLNLVVYLNPEAFNHTLLQCDEDGTADGRTLFNLNQANAVLTNNVSGLSTRFYTDAARTAQVDGNAFTNTSNPQTIYVDVVNDATGCSSPSELTLNVSVTDSGDTQLIACDDDGAEDGFFNFNLSDADSAIVSGLPTGLTIAYYETYDDALLETNNLGTSFTNTNPYSQIIYARVENANNCYGISEVALTVNELPDIETEALAYYCLNFFPDTIALDAAVINDSPSNYTYSWSTGESTYQINVNQAGTYNVTVTNANGCTKQRTITVEPSNIATFETIEVVDATQNNTITVLVSGEGVYEYRLLDENNVVYAPYQESNMFENVSPGIYTLTVRDIKNNCGTVQDLVSVIGFPKFFTPNNDGDNDTWQVQGISGMFQPNTNILIFNRFGKLIKQLNPLGEGWDGLFNGEKLPADDYWFAVTLQDGRIFKNHFTLKY
ncbi:T9SS type B sorting domain-containing protein [Hwangdonia seohaensis]|uniref:T9SS type B sorting domain-containing protein n=1 Tax=Hwangdonia seohaensis TaxID=1240727 RepID=A0ABW3RDY5_9FLAO